MASPLPATAVTVAYQERFRPQLSYSPASNWMNDPNGLVYHNGEYHLFYQYNPNGDVWGDMSWGHAVSPDLVHWSELPVALTVEKSAGGKIAQSFFSGSAVVDHANSSGLASDGQGPMVAIYTSVYPEARTLPNGVQVRAGQQSQSLASSTDSGRSWTEYAGNPVLALPAAPYGDEYREFRDPKVFWYAPHAKWVMVVVVAQRHTALWYSSVDLLSWEFMSEFGPAGATGGVWECPDLFALPVDDNPAANKWVLVINLNPGGPAGGSGAQYFLGQFDGYRFVADASVPASGAAPQVVTAQPGEAVLWLDYGPDFYAAVSWNDAPGNARILVGWMSNWLYAQAVPTAPWRSAQSVARELGLRTIHGAVRLTQQPVAAFTQLRRTCLLALTEWVIPAGTTVLAPVGGAPLDMELLLTPGNAGQVGVHVHAGAAERTVIAYDCALGQLRIDRRASGDVSFSPLFAGVHGAPVALVDGALRLRIVVDTASVTVFAGAGEVVLSSQVFPGTGSAGVALFADAGGATVRHLQLWQLASIHATSAD